MCMCLCVFGESGSLCVVCYFFSGGKEGRAIMAWGWRNEQEVRFFCLMDEESWVLEERARGGGSIL